MREKTKFYLMLVQKEKTFSQIAAEVGYNDDTTFYRNFLRITGITPSKYRSILLNNATKNEYKT